MKRLGRILSTAVILIAGCEPNNPPTDRRPALVVFAAASMADALRDIADRFEARNEVQIEISAAASGILRRQIESGAPCDVFVSADPLHMDRLQAAGLIRRETRADIASNALVIVTRTTPQRAWTSPEPLADEAIERIAIANPGYAPAGRYAKAALEHHKLWSRVEPKIVFGDDVRLTLQQLLIGGVPCGIIYASDAATTSAVQIAYTFDSKSHPQILYPAAVIKRSAVHPAAEKFCRFLTTDTARAILRSYGFSGSPQTTGSRNENEVPGPVRSADNPS